jgi:hypothetical protein
MLKPKKSILTKSNLAPSNHISTNFQPRHSNPFEMSKDAEGGNTTIL